MECTEPVAGNGVVVTSHKSLVHTGCFYVEFATVRNFLQMVAKKTWLLFQLSEIGVTGLSNIDDLKSATASLKQLVRWVLL
jgi:hypothetical protein